MESDLKRKEGGGQWTLSGADDFRKRQRLLEDSLLWSSGPKAKAKAASSSSVTLEELERHEKARSAAAAGPISTNMLGRTAAKPVDSETVATAETALSQWYRGLCRTDPDTAEAVRREVGMPQPDAKSEATAKRPRVILQRLSKSALALRFLRQKRTELLGLCSAATDQGDPETMARLYQALATFHEILGDIPLALEAITTAVKAASVEQAAGDTTAVTEADLYRYMQERLTRQTLMDDMREQALMRSKATVAPPKPQAVPRVSAKELTFADFYENYAVKKKPVIITDAVASMTATPWTFDYIIDRIGHLETELKTYDPESSEWARLETMRSASVADFVRSVVVDPGEKGYLFDWSLPIHAPSLAQEVSIPRYFANNFLQRTCRGTLNRDSWPSLFIAPAGVRSEMHIDAFGSNFWMALMVGKKKWTFFGPEDTHLLYPQYNNSLDPTFAVSLSDPDVYEKFPAFALATLTECVLEAGELLFVPAGSPHTVLNLTKTLALSGNVVDASNLDYAVRELTAAGLAHRPYRELAEVLSSPSFDRSMDMDPIDVPCSALLEDEKDRP